MASTHVRPSFPRRLGTAVAAIALSAGTLGLYGSFAQAAVCSGPTTVSSLSLLISFKSTGGSTPTAPYETLSNTAYITYTGAHAVDVSFDGGTTCASYAGVDSVTVVSDKGSGIETVTLSNISDTGAIPTTSVDLAGKGSDGVVIRGTTGADMLDVRDLTLSNGVDLLSFYGLVGNDVLVDDGDLPLADVTFGGDEGIDTVDLSHRGSGWTWTMPADVENAIGGSGANVITGNAAANTIRGGAGGDTLNGGANNDVLLGEAGGDILNGDEGSDILVGGADGDTFNGGGGTDTVSYNNSQYSGAASAGVEFSLGKAGAQTTGGAGSDTVTAGTVENLIGSSYGDTLTGDDGDNVIGGHLGNDTIRGGDGEDVLDGSVGVDTVSYADSDIDEGVKVNLGSAYPTGGFADGDLIGDFENVTGSSENDTLTGTAAANVIDGGKGNDTIAGLAGADTLKGGSGARDTVTYAASAAGVSVSLAAGSGKGGDAEGDKLSGFENLVGSDEDDTLIGNRVANSISGGDGDDFLTGDLSADLIDGGDGNDTVSYAYSSEGVTVSLRTGTSSGDGTAGDTLKSIENVIGSSYADTITGNDGKNVLNGGGGNDTIIALGGADRLYGSTGSDTLNGGDGGDRLEGGGGADKIDGGSGTDVCKDGPGKDTVTDCEK